MPWGGLFSWSDKEKFSEKSSVVGFSKCRFNASVNVKENLMWQQAKELYEPCKEYGWPDRSPDSEKRSYKLQCDRHVTSENRKQPSKEEIDLANSILLKQYKQHSLCKALIDFDEVKLKELIGEMMSCVKRDSSPGTPYASVSSSNGELFDKFGCLIAEVCYDRLIKRLETPLEVLSSMTQMELVDSGLMDPVRIFVKNEPTKMKKIKEGRVRLIHSVSVVDKIIEMVLIRHLTKLEIANWFRIPSKPGIGFTHEDNECVYEDIMNSLPMSASDVEGWDWNVDQWQLSDDAEMVILLCENASEEWKHSIRACAILEGKSVYQFSDGLLVVNEFLGLVNSGKYKTSSGNSRMRTKLATLVGARKTIAAGDDAVETTVVDAIRKYAEYGFKIKAYDTVEDSFEFCSRIYGKDGSWPLNAGKMMMNLLHNVPKNDFEFRMFLMGFENDLGEHPDFEAIMEIIRSVGYLELAGAQEDV